MHPQDTTIPYGYCHCGCGGKTAIAKQTDRAKGHVRGEPKKYLRGHQGRRLGVDYNTDGPNPGGMCLCGCGQPTPIAKMTELKYGWVKGTPMRYILGHALRTQPQRPSKLDNLTPPLCACGCGQTVHLSFGAKGLSRKYLQGHATRVKWADPTRKRWDPHAYWQRPRTLSGQLCACGCGQETYLERVTDLKIGHIKGQPQKFLRGHYARSIKVWKHKTRSPQNLSPRQLGHGGVESVAGQVRPSLLALQSARRPISARPRYSRCATPLWPRRTLQLSAALQEMQFGQGDQVRTRLGLPPSRTPL